MFKFGRNYRLVFEIGAIENTFSQGGQSTFDFSKPVIYEILEVAYPLTLTFSVSRDTFSQVNVANFRILGLNENTRTRLYKDRDNVRKFVRVQFFAGYGDNMPLVFNGSLKEGSSYRESGGTEFGTNLECWDGGFGVYWAHSNRTFAKGIDSTTILNILTSDFQTIELGGISDSIVIPETQRDKVFVGRTWDCIREYVNNNMFIDNERIYYMLTDEDVRQGDLLVIDADSGLLSSPRRRDKVIEVELLFEPRVVLGQQIVVRSDTVDYLNGTYKIIGIDHEGVISGAIGGRLTTKVSLFIGTKIFNQIREL